MHCLVLVGAWKLQRGYYSDSSCKELALPKFSTPFNRAVLNKLVSFVHVTHVGVRTWCLTLRRCEPKHQATLVTSCPMSQSARSSEPEPWNQTAVSWRATLCGIFRDTLKRKGMHVFWTWAPFFWTCTCFLDLTGFFFWELGSQKMWGTSLCVFYTLWGYFFGPACICAGPMFFFDSQINCFWARLLFFGPVHLLRGPCLHRVGGNSIVIDAHIGLDVFGPWRLLCWNPHTFFLDLAQGEGNLDTETRCMQEVVDAGEVPVLKQ